MSRFAVAQNGLVVRQNLRDSFRSQHLFALLPRCLAGLVRGQQQVDHALVPCLTRGLQEEGEFA